MDKRTRLNVTSYVHCLSYCIEILTRVRKTTWNTICVFDFEMVHRCIIYLYPTCLLIMSVSSFIKRRMRRA